MPDGKIGWVASQFVQTSMVLDALAVATPPPTPQPSETPALVATQTPAPEQLASRKDLEVTFINMHYECQQGEWQYTDDNSVQHPLWGYRSFQADMYIRNNGTQPVEPPWGPRRWIITDGNQEVISTLWWQWVDRRSGQYPQPVIQPGQSAGWTFMAFPIDRNQWVKAVEFVWHEQVYRSEIDLGPFGNAYNYKDCGDPRSHTERPTPTPRP
jgi:hypothetical protein